MGHLTHYIIKTFCKWFKRTYHYILHSVCIQLSVNMILYVSRTSDYVRSLCAIYRDNSIISTHLHNWNFRGNYTGIVFQKYFHCHLHSKLQIINIIDGISYPFYDCFVKTMLCIVGSSTILSFIGCPMAAILDFKVKLTLDYKDNATIGFLVLQLVGNDILFMILGQPVKKLCVTQFLESFGSGRWRPSWISRSNWPWITKIIPPSDFLS